MTRFFRAAVIKERSVSDTSGTRNAGQEPLEELVEIQALSVDLREAVMACLSGGESRRWTIDMEVVKAELARSLSAERDDDPLTEH
jgi:hypothetical protein